jgi:PAS domain S-box-containing protein
VPDDRHAKAVAGPAFSRDRAAVAAVALSTAQRSSKGCIMAPSSDFFKIFDHDKNFLEIMKRLLESSLELSFNGIMITEASPGYPILYVNPAFCQMTGYGPQELLMKSPSILQGPKTDPEVLDRLSRMVAAGQLFHGRAVNYRKDGSEFMMEWKIAPIRNATGTISHYLAIQKDVSHEY